MTIKRYPYKIDRGIPYHITTLLKYLGVAYSQRRNFWLRNEHQLPEILVDAKQAHRRLVRIYHPDKGGDVKVCAFLNAVFQRIKLLFSRKGIQLCE